MNVMTELIITPAADIFDLLLGIGLIALGLAIMAVLITIEICERRAPSENLHRMQHSEEGMQVRKAGAEIRGSIRGNGGRVRESDIRCCTPDRAAFKQERKAA